jgi:hypothetical protein
MGPPKGPNGDFQISRHRETARTYFCQRAAARIAWRAGGFHGETVLKIEPRATQNQSDGRDKANLDIIALVDDI